MTVRKQYLGRLLCCRIAGISRAFSWAIVTPQSRCSLLSRVYLVPVHHQLLSLYSRNFPPLPSSLLITYPSSKQSQPSRILSKHIEVLQKHDKHHHRTRIHEKLTSCLPVFTLLNAMIREQNPYGDFMPIMESMCRDGYSKWEVIAESQKLVVSRRGG